MNGPQINSTLEDEHICKQSSNFCWMWKSLSGVYTYKPCRNGVIYTQRKTNIFDAFRFQPISFTDIRFRIRFRWAWTSPKSPVQYS